MTNLDPLQQQRGRASTDDQLARWREYVESHVAQEIAAEHEFVMQIMAGVLGEFSAQSRAEVGRTIASKLGHAKGPKGERGEAGPIGPQGDWARQPVLQPAKVQESLIKWALLALKPNL